jgi:pyrimidine operon attenuation protein/uracil phosphoribosyltransferase
MEKQTKLKATIMDEQQMHKAIVRMSHEIIERNSDLQTLALIGIQRRGLPIAHQIATAIEAAEGVKVPVGAVDITLYRDDLSIIAELPQIKTTELPFPITAANVVLVDDVLYTGRSVRAALEVLIQEGRPKSIQLAVLVDRGHRELPIGADYVGKMLSSSHNELVSVSVKEIDGESKVEIFE